MLTDLLWGGVLLFLVIFGLGRPYLALCLVIWVDILKPQDNSFGVLAGAPLSLIATAVFFLSLVFHLNDVVMPRKKKPTVYVVIFMIWLTICTFYAEFQAAAWFKYDFVIKTLFFSIFIPFVIDDRRKLETVVAMLVTAIGYYTMLGGMRTFFGAGQYGNVLVYTRAGDSGITETSTLAMVSVLTLAMIYYLFRESRLMRRVPFSRMLLLGLAFSCLLTNIGTVARTGLVGFAALFVVALYYSRYKSRIVATLLLVAIIVSPFISESYMNRMGTLQTATEEGSALGRIVVWRWTLDYVADRPIMGGGFSAYKANAGVLSSYTDSKIQLDLKADGGKAFHNIFFEVLGESGYVGLIIYLLIIFSTWRLTSAVIKEPQSDPWKVLMAQCLNAAGAVYCTCGMFIGVAYSPWLFYLAGLSAALHNIPNRIDDQVLVSV